MATFESGWNYWTKTAASGGTLQLVGGSGTYLRTVGFRMSKQLAARGVLLLCTNWLGGCGEADESEQSDSGNHASGASATSSSSSSGTSSSSSSGAGAGGGAGGAGGGSGEIQWPTTWEDPLVVNSAATIRGRNIRSQTDAPVVSINTTEPVLIEDCYLQSEAGGRIITNNPGQPNIDVTIRNNRARALYPGGDGRSVGRFVIVQFVQSLIIEHNYFENTGGIYVLGPQPTPSATILVRYNSAKNINGYVTDGAGSYRCPGGVFSDPNSVCDNSFGAGGHVPAQFLQTDKVQNVSGMEVSWNQILNEPYESLVEDVFSFGNSSGNAASPILVHDNFVKGAYAIHPKVDGYTGGGMSMGDGAGAYITAYDNQVIKSQNYGIAIFAGTNMVQRDSRVVSSGLLDDGTPMHGSSDGLQMPAGPVEPGQSAHDLVIGLAYGDGSRHDWYDPAIAACGGLCYGLTHFSGQNGMSGPPTLAEEAAEFASWLSKVQESGTIVGVQP